eukprot:scaffold55145_cov54-Phaeocystis_antarctica.AAC.1
MHEAVRVLIRCDAHLGAWRGGRLAPGTPHPRVGIAHALRAVRGPAGYHPWFRREGDRAEQQLREGLDQRLCRRRGTEHRRQPRPAALPPVLLHPPLGGRQPHRSHRARAARRIAAAAAVTASTASASSAAAASAAAAASTAAATAAAVAGAAPRGLGAVRKAQHPAD